MKFSLLLFTLLQAQVRPHSLPTALSFGLDATSYIMLQMNMEPVKEAVSVCSWVLKRTSEGTYDAWFTYNAPSRIHEILIAGRISIWAYMLKSNTANSQEVLPDTWHHVCLTWSYETKKTILYFDGEAIAEKETGETKLTVGGTMAIGQYHRQANMEATFHSHPFGGQLLKMNIYTRQLKPQEVEDMFYGGLCSDNEDKLVEDTFLRWETILYATERKGNVTEVPVTCSGDHWNVLYFPDFFNKVSFHAAVVGDFICIVIKILILLYHSSLFGSIS